MRFAEAEVKAKRTARIAGFEEADATLNRPVGEGFVFVDGADNRLHFILSEAVIHRGQSAFACFTIIKSKRLGMFPSIVAGNRMVMKFSVAVRLVPGPGKEGRQGRRRVLCGRFSPPTTTLHFVKVEPSQHAGTRTHADRRLGVAALKMHAGFRQPVQMRREHVPCAQCLDCVEALLVGGEEKEIRLRGHRIIFQDLGAYLNMT